jgi:hypothetical protein
MQVTITKATLYKSLGVVSALLTIAVALQSLQCNHAPTPATSLTKVTRHAEAIQRTDTIVVHDTIRWAIYLRAKANRAVDTLLVSSGDSQRVSLACLDSLFWSNDTSAAGPDTLSICHDEQANQFFLDLRLAVRNRTIAAPFTHTDSLIYENASTTITTQPTLWDKILSGLQFLGAAAIGFLVGIVTHL